MKLINIIGILLILLISTLGNRIAPGRYCTYYKSDTVRAFGQTQNAENDKHGFWVFLDRWENKQNLSCVMNFENNKRNGWLVEFQGDSLQNKYSEIYYKNDIVDGTTKFYNMQGKCNLIVKYKNGEMTYNHYLIYEDFGFVDFMAPGAEKPSETDSMIVDASLHNLNPFLDLDISPQPDDQIVVFNSWTNKITASNIVICCILLILNFFNLTKNGKNKN